jgi:hypothetical protein
MAIRVNDLYGETNPLTGEPWRPMSERRQKFILYSPWRKLYNSIRQNLDDLLLGREAETRIQVRRIEQGEIIKLQNAILPTRLDGLIIVLGHRSDASRLALIDFDPFERIRLILFDPLVQRLRKDDMWKEAPGSGTRASYKTTLLANTFKQMKDDHPDWTQAKVAMEAGDKLNVSITPESVRNAYRAMHWKWLRGGRSR